MIDGIFQSGNNQATKIKYAGQERPAGHREEPSSHAEAGARSPNFLSGVSICEADCCLNLAKPALHAGRHRQGTGRFRAGQRCLPPPE